jgi:hypothetical protein
MMKAYSVVKRWWFSLAAVGLLACDGSARPGEVMRTELEYVGAYGELVCSETAVVDAKGAVTVLEREYYHLDVINNFLTGRTPTDEAELAAVRAGGLKRVETCAQARQYMRLQNAYLDSLPIGPVFDEPPALPDGPLEADPSRIDKVADSRTFYDPPTVRLIGLPGGKFCSGQLINAAYLITSAHCFPASGDFRVIVDYGTAKLDASGNRICINAGGCNPPAGNNMWVIRYPNYAGLTDTRRDIALVFHYTGGWQPPANTVSSWVPLKDDRSPNGGLAGKAVWISGYGHNRREGGGTGVGRLSNNMDWIRDDLSGYWIGRVTTGWGRPCAGDSGSPGQNWDNGFALSVGVFSNFDYYDDDVCGAPDLKYRYTKVGDKISWLNMVGDGMCSRTYTGQWPHTFSYTKCWE